MEIKLLASSVKSNTDDKIEFGIGKFQPKGQLQKYNYNTITGVIFGQEYL